MIKSTTITPHLRPPRRGGGPDSSSGTGAAGRAGGGWTFRADGRSCTVSPCDGRGWLPCAPGGELIDRGSGCDITAGAGAGISGGRLTTRGIATPALGARLGVRGITSGGGMDGGDTGGNSGTGDDSCRDPIPGWCGGGAVACACACAALWRTFVTCASPLPASGNFASSVILMVGATRASAVGRRSGPPQLPQNRESASMFSVPHAGQRIPRPA